MHIQLKRVTATAAVLENLKQRIINCEFCPGEKLPSEQLLLQEYDVSRLTLREALAKLAAWGVIEVRHGKGAYVSENISIPALDNVLIPMFPRKNINSMTELVEARNMIEAEIAGKVAENRTEDDIRQLKKILTYDNRVITNPEMFADQDYSFHLTLAMMAGNQFFLSMYQALHNQIRFFLIKYAKSIIDWEEALNRHNPILDAIIRRDPGEARLLAKQHARICASYIEQYNSESG
jgi:GntR family transcriptional regulator, transcriptional repressor for pyruvate dehydrogenase complex